MRYIPSSIFTMGSDSGYPEEAPAHLTKISEFYLDETPVTNAEYKKYCDSTGKIYPSSPAWDEYSDYFMSCPDSPVIRVSRIDAMAYALWSGKRLPSEEEWEFAASGGMINAVYPWGVNEYEANKYANFAGSCTEYEWRNPYFNGIYKHTSPVKSYLPNHFGLYDMAGNVWEWTSGYYYDYKKAGVKDDMSGGKAVQRGGCYHSTTRDLRITRRRRAEESEATSFCGFRCAIDVSDANKILAGDRSADPIYSPYSGALNLDFIAPKTDQTRPIQLNMQKFLATETEKCITSAAENEYCAVFIAPCNIDPVRLAELGFTCVEQFIDWESCERKGKGEWDFSIWDKLYLSTRAAGLKWRPCLIAFPGCSLPRWYRESHEFTPLICLEHNMSSGTQSIWDKRFLRHLERFFAAVSKHFSAFGPLDGISLAVGGMSGAELPNQINYFYTEKSEWNHCHTGYWCGDIYARESFRSVIAKKYDTIYNLNVAWGTNYTDFEKVTFPQIFTTPDNFRVDEPTAAGNFHSDLPGQRRQLVDFIDWYRTSLTDYCSDWLKLAQKYFRETPITLCIGNKSECWLATEIGAQCKVAAEYGTNVRIINSANAKNKLISVKPAVSACIFYGTPYIYCSTTTLSVKNSASTIFDISAAGACEFQICDLSGKVNINHIKQFILSDNIKYLINHKPKRDIAVLFSDLPALFDYSIYDSINKFFTFFRDFSDFMYMDDTMIADGALNNIKALFIHISGIYRSETLKKIKKFVTSGGLLITVGIDEMTALDGDLTGHSNFFVELMKRRGNGTRNVGRGVTLRLDFPNDIKSRIAIEHNYAVQIADFLRSHGVDLPDGQLDGIYTSTLVNHSGSEINTLTCNEHNEIQEIKKDIKYNV